MTRQAGALTLLGVVLVLVLYYLFVWSPKTDEVAELESQIEDTIAQQGEVQGDIRRLEDVRSRAPEIESALAAAQSVIPFDSGLPGALRQLQVAADDAGATLVSVQPSRPSTIEEVDVTVAGRELATLNLAVQVDGGYYQLVDFLRRVETPTITPRGIVWTGTSISVEEYPTLNMSVTGQMYALLEPVPGGDEETTDAGEQPPDPDATATEGATGEPTPQPTVTEEQP